MANNDLKKFTQEIRLTSPTSNGFEWQIGAFYTHEKAALVQNLDSITAPSGPYIATLIYARSSIPRMRRAPGS